MLKKKLTISLAYDCAKEWRTVVALQGGEQWLKAMPKSFTFAFRLGLSLSFNSKNKAPKKMGGTKSSQAALLALYLARERERERVNGRKRIQRQRAQLRWKWNERVSERPAERIRNNRNGRLRARVTPSGAATPAEAEAATPAEQRIAVSSPFTWV